MNFHQNLILHLLSTTDSTMKGTFDHAIQYARDKEPGFVKSYKWPVKISEPTKEQSGSSNLTRSYEQVSSGSSLIDITHGCQVFYEPEEDDGDLRYNLYNDYEVEYPGYYDLYDEFEDGYGLDLFDDFEGADDYTAYYTCKEADIYNALSDEEEAEEHFWAYEDCYAKEAFYNDGFIDDDFILVLTDVDDT